MQLHNLKAKTKRVRSRQRGRGGAKGKTSGRGTKGQNARAGRKIRPEFRDVIKRLPKLRGRGKNSNKSIVRVHPVEISLAIIEKNFENGEKVSAKILRDKGLIEIQKGKLPRVKILSSNDFTKKLSFIGIAMTDSAKQLVEKIGGTVIITK